MKEDIKFESQVIQVGGDSIGVVIPKPTAEYLGIVKGNKVKVIIVKVEACQEQKQ